MIICSFWSTSTSVSLWWLCRWRFVCCRRWDRSHSRSRDSCILACISLNHRIIPAKGRSMHNLLRICSTRRLYPSGHCLWWTRWVWSWRFWCCRTFAQQIDRYCLSSPHPRTQSKTLPSFAAELSGTRWSFRIQNWRCACDRRCWWVETHMLLRVHRLRPSRLLSSSTCKMYG